MKAAQEKSECRFCRSTNLIPLLDLGRSPLCDEYRLDKIADEYFPLALNGCRNCSAVQTSHVVSPEDIHSQYVYHTSSSALEEHFHEYVKAILKSVRPTKGSFIVDIGSNDGCLLSKFKRAGFRVLGVGPSAPAAKYPEEIHGVEKLGIFNYSTAEEIAKKHGKASIVTFNNVFANIDNLEKVWAGIDELLSDDGVIVIESSYLYDMIDNMVFDFIYHEHLSYLSLRPLEYVAQNHGFRVFDVERVPTKGGSLRYFLCRISAKYSGNTSLEKLLEFEAKRLDLLGEFQKFGQRIDRANKEFIQSLERKTSQSQGRIVGYGASATSTTLLHFWNFGNKISMLIDDNIYKHHTLSPGFGIPVNSLSEAKLNSEDTVVILAWRFKESIIDRLKDFAGTIICPLPSLVEIGGKT